MPRPRKAKPEAIILPPELDDDDEEVGSVMPDDDGWITLEGGDGDGKQGRRDSGDSQSGKAKRMVGRADRRPKSTRRRDS